MDTTPVANQPTRIIKFNKKLTAHGCTVSVTWPSGRTQKKRFVNGYVSAEISADKWIKDQIKFLREAEQTNDTAPLEVYIDNKPINDTKNTPTKGTKLYAVIGDEMFTVDFVETYTAPGATEELYVVRDKDGLLYMSKDFYVDSPLNAWLRALDELSQSRASILNEFNELAFKMLRFERRLEYVTRQIKKLSFPDQSTEK